MVVPQNKNSGNCSSSTVVYGLKAHSATQQCQSTEFY